MAKVIIAAEGQGMNNEPTQSRLELLYEISRELVSSLDLKIVLEKVLALSTSNVGAERGMLIALDEDEQPLEAAIIYQNKLKPHDHGQLNSILSGGLAGWVVRNREAALVSDTSQDERWLRRPDDAEERSGPKSAVCIPILLAKTNLVGVLTIVHPQTGFFNEEHFALLQAIADQAGVAMHNANLYRSLDEAHLRYRELFEDSVDPVVITDRSGNVLEANRRAMDAFDLEHDDLLGVYIGRLHRIDWETVGSNFENLFDGSETCSYESCLLGDCDDSRTAVAVYVHLIRIDGEVDFQWIFRDISERKELESMQGDLIGMIYHDLRSPLSNVISSLDMLKMLLPEDLSEDALQIFEIAFRSAERTKRLSSSLLDIQRLEAGQSMIKRQFVDVEDLIKDSVEIVGFSARNKKQSVQVKKEDDLPEILADEDMIRRVLVNLLENATKFTPSKGEITLIVQQNDENIRFIVQDSGPGIPKDAQELIFEKYQQLKTKQMPRGIGLGLAFCRLAVLGHGGRIWVESEEGRGSRFQFTLPVEIDSK